jgi:hypothetical protein
MRAAYLIATSVLLAIIATANAQEIDWKKVEAALGRTGAVSGEAHRYGFPRSDLQVRWTVFPSGPPWHSAVGLRSSPPTAEQW